MTSKTYKSMKDKELRDAGYVDFGNQGHSQPIGSWINANTTTQFSSNHHDPSSSIAPFQREPIDNFTNNRSQFHVPWQESSDQRYKSDSSETNYLYGVRYQNLHPYQMPGIMGNTLNNHALTTDQTQTGAYLGSASHYGTGPKSIANHPLSVLPEYPSPAPIPMPVLETKPYACMYGCGKAYARKGDMERHARSHEPPGFLCVVEGCKFQVKGFYRKDKWVTHLKTHGYSQ